MMKKLSLFLLLSVVMFMSSCSDDDKAQVTLNFDSLLSSSESEMDYNGGEKVDTYYSATTFTDPQNLVTFTNYYASWGFGGGFTYTNKSFEDSTNYTNLSSVPGKGVNGQTYLTVSLSNTATMTIKNSSLYRFKELYVTNSSYAYCVMRDGNTQSATPFGADDWFKLTIYNADKSASIDVMLAEGTNFLSTWKLIDLSPLGDTDELQFEMSSTQNNSWGMTTPNYFCMDGITLIEK
jgi:hypothetical protein